MIDNMYDGVLMIELAMNVSVPARHEDELVMTGLAARRGHFRSIIMSR